MQDASYGYINFGHVVNKNLNGFRFGIYGLYHRFGHGCDQFSFLFHTSSFKHVHMDDGHFILLVSPPANPLPEDLVKQ